VLVLSAGDVAYSGAAADLIEHPERFAEAGLVAPDVLRVQQAARERGGDLGPFTLDPQAAAENIAAGAGWR
jgi:hypothetical protein